MRDNGRKEEGKRERKELRKSGKGVRRKGGGKEREKGKVEWVKLWVRIYLYSWTSFPLDCPLTIVCYYYDFFILYEALPRKK